MYIFHLHNGLFVAMDCLLCDVSSNKYTSESLEQLLVDVILPLEWRKNYHLHF